MQKVSIVVPIYNSEKVLERCVDSLLKQTYETIEIILVNDGSKDQSPQICQKYINTDSRVVLVNKPNGGLGSARNAGIEHCTGDFICFVDSDDWVDHDFVQVLLSLINRYNADVASVGIDITSTYHISSSKIKDIANNVYEGKDIIHYFYKGTLTDSNLFSVCTSIYKKDIIGNYRFREKKINEDMDFKLKVLKNSNKWVVKKDRKYHYFQAGSSLSSGVVKKSDLDLIEASSILIEMAQETEDLLCIRYAKIASKKNFFSLLIRMAVFGCHSDMNQSLWEKRCLKELRENYISLMSSPIKKSRKILITFFCINYPFTRWLLQKLYKII